MRNVIMSLTLVGSLVLVSAAWARGGEERVELDRIWHVQQLRQREWADVMHETGPAKKEALRNYTNNLPRLWKADEDG